MKLQPLQPAMLQQLLRLPFYSEAMLSPLLRRWSRYAQQERFFLAWLYEALNMASSGNRHLQ